MRRLAFLTILLLLASGSAIAGTSFLMDGFNDSGHAQEAVGPVVLGDCRDPKDEIVGMIYDVNPVTKILTTTWRIESLHGAVQCTGATAQPATSDFEMYTTELDNATTHEGIHQWFKATPAGVEAHWYVAEGGDISPDTVTIVPANYGIVSVSTPLSGTFTGYYNNGVHAYGFMGHTFGAYAGAGTHATWNAPPAPAGNPHLTFIDSVQGTITLN